MERLSSENFGKAQENNKMIRPPSTYAEWVSILDIFDKKIGNDEATISAMRQGTLNWQSGVAERFTKKLTEVINDRLNAASDKFQRDINHTMGQDCLVIQALLRLRMEIENVFKITELNCVPEKYRVEYGRLVLEHADKMQKSLDLSARNDRTGKLSAIVRNHRVNDF